MNHLVRLAGEDRESSLAAAFEVARAHPLWRSFYRDCADWRQAPACQKTDLVAALGGFSLRTESRGVYLVRSSGRTTAPLIFPVDIGENLAQRQSLADQLTAQGVIAPTSVILNLFAYCSLYRTAAIIDDLVERCQATTLPISAQAPYGDMHAAAELFGPTHLAGTPSVLTQFAGWCEERGEQAPQIPHLIYAGEVLRDSVRERLRQLFGFRQIWSLYGGAETGIWAFCDASAEPGLFTVLPQIVVEIEAPDAEGFGEIVATNTLRRRFPLFRYNQGDIGRLVRRGDRTLLEIRGRRPCSFRFYEVTHDDAGFPAIAHDCAAWQARLDYGADGCDRLVLLVVPGERSDLAAVAERLRLHMKQAEGAGTTEVRPARFADLQVDPVTGKAASVIDLRR